MRKCSVLGAILISLLVSGCKDGNGAAPTAESVSEGHAGSGESEAVGLASGDSGPVGIAMSGTRASPSAPLPAAAVPMPGFQSSPAQARALRQDQLQRLQAGFHQEQRSPKWASAMEGRLLNLEQPQGVNFPVATAVNTECRSQTCRVNFAFPRNGNIQGWLNAYRFALGPHLSTVRTISMPKPDGSTEVFIFASE